jgi:hypothetical protein
MQGYIRIMSVSEYAGLPDHTLRHFLEYRIALKSHDVCNTSLCIFFGAYISAFVINSHSQIACITSKLHRLKQNGMLTRSEEAGQVPVHHRR